MSFITSAVSGSLIMLLLLWPLTLAAVEPRTVVTPPCTVGWVQPDARAVVAFRLYRHGAQQSFVTGQYVTQMLVAASSMPDTTYQAPCAAFGLVPGRQAIAVSAVDQQGIESSRSPTLLLEVR